METNRRTRFLALVGIVFTGCGLSSNDQMIIIRDAGLEVKIDASIKGDLQILAPNVTLRGDGTRISGNILLSRASSTSLINVNTEGKIEIQDSAGATVTNSRASELNIANSENVVLAGNQIVGGCNMTSTNGLVMTGNICESMFLGGSLANPFTSSTIRYNIIRNLKTDLSNGGRETVEFLRQGRVSQIQGAGVELGTDGPCPTTTHVVEYNYFEGNHLGNSTYDDEPFVFRFRCARSGAYDPAHGIDLRNKFRFNTFKANGVQVSLYFRDSTDNMLVEGNALLANNPKFHAALMMGTGNEGGYSDDSSENLFVRNLIYARSPVTAAAYFQGIDGNNRFERNVFASTDGQAISLIMRAPGNEFINNTFYTERDGNALILDATTTSDVSQRFDYNIVTIKSARISDLVVFDHNALANYSGSHNLYFNSVGTENVLARDVESRAGDPKFVNASQFDFRLTDVTSAAIASGHDTQDLGAFSHTETCTGNWVCSAWSSCINNQEIRICPGLNDCGQPNPQPYQTRACGSGGVDPTPTPLPTLVPTPDVTPTIGSEQKFSPSTNDSSVEVSGGCAANAQEGSIYSAVLVSLLVFSRRRRYNRILNRHMI